MITRRCTQRMLLLRPDETTNQTFLYCLAYAAQQTGVEVMYSMALSNHHHTILYDPGGRVPAFNQRFHSLSARAMNALRGRWENFWADEQPGQVKLVKEEAVLDKIAYAAANPVTAQLVEHVEHWPGAHTTAEFFSGQALCVERPEHFFRADGPTPERVVLRLAWPEHLGPIEEARKKLRQRLDDLQAQARQQRTSEKRAVLGRAGVRRQDFHARPTTWEPRRGLRPTVAARNRWARVEALQRNRAFQDAYRAALRQWLAGFPAEFPPGTYLMRGKPGVVILE
jgi:putative transposase